MLEYLAPMTGWFPVSSQRVLPSPTPSYSLPRGRGSWAHLGAPFLKVLRASADTGVSLLSHPTGTPQQARTAKARAQRKALLSTDLCTRASTPIKWGQRRPLRTILRVPCRLSRSTHARRLLLTVAIPPRASWVLYYSLHTSYHGPH